MAGDKKGSGKGEQRPGWDYVEKQLNPSKPSSPPRPPVRPPAPPAKPSGGSGKTGKGK